MHISWARLASFYHLGVISDPLIVFKFHNETHDPKGQENKIYTIVKGRETFYRRHTVPLTSCSAVKYVLKTDCSTQNFPSLKHLISKTDFTAKKYSGQGSFKVEKGTIDKLLFLLKTIGIYPLQVSMILWRPNNSTKSQEYSSDMPCYRSLKTNTIFNISFLNVFCCCFFFFFCFTNFIISITCFNNLAIKYLKTF